MSAKSCLFAVVIAASLTLAAQIPALADSLRVSPINLHLDAKGAGVLNLANQGDEPISAQIEAFDWQQADGKDQLTPSKTLQVSPPIIRLPPHSKQIVRIRATAPSRTKERAYRLVVSELPSPSDQAKGRVRILLQFKLPVFVGGTQTTPRLLSWVATSSGSNLVLQVQNRGDRHVKLAGLHVAGAGGKDIAIEPDSFTYVLPGASHEWAVPGMQVAPGTRLHVEGIEESTGSKIDYTVVAGR